MSETAVLNPTDKLFYDKPQLFSCEARLLSIEGDPGSPFLVFDRTIFYPEGGGQACDLGRISSLDNSLEAQLVSVLDRHGRVLHRLGTPSPFSVGDSLRLFVDRERRIDYSQQHTAEHLIGSVALRLIGANVLSVHFAAENSYIDFDLPRISDEDIQAIEDEVEAAISEDYQIRYHVCPPEDVASFPLRRKPPEVEGEALRVVEIDGLDYSACCGLHMVSTGTLRLVRIFPAENYKGGSRVYFLAGARAAGDYHSLARQSRRAAACLGSSEAQLAEAVKRESERRKELEFQLVGLERERAQAEVERELSSLKAGGGALHLPLLVIKTYEDRGADSLIRTAKAFADAQAIAVLASLPDLTVQLLAPSADARLGERLKDALRQSGGRGGGGPANFRAVFAGKEALEQFLVLVKDALGEA